MTYRYRVVVVDDDEDLRFLVRHALESTGRCEVVAEAENGAVAVDAAAAHQPDLTILDLHMPVMDGFTALPRIRSSAPRGLVVVLAGVEPPELSTVVEDGAAAFLVKGKPPSVLADALVELLDQGQLGGEAVVDRFVVYLAHELTSARSARKAVRGALQRWDAVGLVDEAELLTSEVVTNALIHAQSPATLAVTRLERRVRVEVTDTGGGNLQLVDAATTDVHGRGLAIVEALAASWGAHDNGEGRTVWFELQQD